jgi:hypothetical protein
MFPLQFKEIRIFFRYCHFPFLFLPIEVGYFILYGFNTSLLAARIIYFSLKSENVDPAIEMPLPAFPN